MCRIGGYVGKRDAGRLEHPGRTQGALSADAALTPSPSSLSLGRGGHQPVALEGALEVEDLAYTHAGSHPAGEMKRAPTVA